MVYESDFYTTRRPYSRPLATSYTVTHPTIVPLSSVIQVRSYPHLPYLAHKRLVTFIHTPIHSAYHTGTPIPIRIHSRVRPSVLTAEYNRIRDLPRSSTRSYTERYLNSKDNIYFDDESREIRAKADALLRRIHVYVPRPSASDFHEDILPERFRSDDYIRRLLGARKNVAKEIETASWYTVPEQRNLGKGNLACVSYVAGKPHSRRRPYYKLADLRAADVKSDVNLLSYYSKNREAAANASPVHHTPLTDREIRKARANETEWSAARPKKAASPVPEPEPEPEPVPEVVSEVIPEEPEVPEAVPEPEPIVEKKKEKKEKKKDKDVKKMDEEAMKRAEEARLLRLEQEEEEHARIALIKAQEEAEQRGIELAAEKAKLAEIAEQERLEVERIIEEERLEEERVEAERIALAERMEAEAEAAAEEERQAAQKAVEEERRKQEEEERLAAEVAAASDALATGSPLGEEAPEEFEETQQEQEEKQIEPIVDEEALIDEVDVEAEEEAAGADETFVEEPVDVEGGGDSAPADEVAIVEEDVANIEEVNTSADADDIWGNNDD